jgi:carboxyl-terminal processing protease
MLQNLRTSTWFLSGTLLGLSLAVGHSVYALKDSDQIPFEDLQAFTEVFSKVKSDYVEPVDDQKLIEDAIRGMLNGLDPHSAFLNTSEFSDLKIGTTGQFGGLGIEVGMENGFVKVISPIDDTPAARAGVKASDLIIKLDDKSVKGISVKNRMLEPGYGYVRITNFQSRTTTDLLKAISDLQKEERLKGMVLDLRNNPGGVLNGAVGVSDAFIDNGLIVYTEGRLDDSSHRYLATPGDSLNGAPLVVLVNGGSASASEIVAGAIQDHKRGIILGTKSFGKGSVQTIQELRNGSAVKLTTARYFTPNGRSIQATGIEPDIKLSTLRLSAEDDKARETYSESDLEGRLSNPNGETDVDDEEKDDSEALAETDFQLYEALNLLKGLIILNQISSG